MATTQENDPKRVSLKSSPSSLVLRDMPLLMSDSTIACDFSTDVPRPYVSPSYRHIVFDSLYSLSHPGIQATQHLVTAWFVRPSINSDISKWVQACIQCLRWKVQRHTVTPLSTFTTCTPDAWFNRIHLDIVGPLPSSNGFTCSPVWTISHIGQKHSQQQISLPRQSLMHLSVVGLCDLEFPQSLQPIDKDSSNPIFASS